MNGDAGKISASELIKLIVSTKPVAEIEDDEDLYVKPQGEIEVDDDGLCTLVVHPDLGSSLDMGNFRIEVGGVDVTVSRGVDGPEDDYEFDGAEIVYGEGESLADVIAAIEENAEFPSYDETQYGGTDFDPDDVEASITVEDGEVYAEDEDGNVYRYSSKEEVPDGRTVIEASAAIHKLVEEWSENGGEADGMFIESFGPWS